MIFLDRFKSDENGTFGMLVKEGDSEPLCFTCELPWLDNHPQTSCIPIGMYQCMAYTSAKHPQAWAVANVPNRSGILIHTGNTEYDSKGCILVGDKLGTINGLPAVLNSKMTMAMLKSKLEDIFELQITAKNL